MRLMKLLVTCPMLLPFPLAAQDNPFALTGGKAKSAYIVYDVKGKDQQGAGSTWEIGVAPDRWMMRMVLPIEFGGKSDTVRTITATTGDSQYAYSSMGSQGQQAEVSPLLRPHLAREYAALSSQGKARFRENVKLLADAGSSSDIDVFVTLFGKKTGSETIAGHQCDVYQTGHKTACVIPGAPLVMLRWTDPKQGLTMIAKRVSLNAPVPPASTVLPKGVKWEQGEPDDADFITSVWEMKKQSDPSTAKPAAIAKYVVHYLASADAAAELREMGMGRGGTAGSEETGDAGTSAEQDEPEN
jgi:hypothetical protein